MKRFLMATLILVLAFSSVALTTPFAVEHMRDAKVYVIHGIPGKDLGADNALPVDVLVNNSICLLKGFTFMQVAGPVSLKPGTYNIQISLANADKPCSNAAVITADVPFAAGENATVIAHLTEAGAPTASKYTNDVSPIPGKLARVTVRHDAAAPAVDIGITVMLGDLTFSTKVPGLSNPNQAGPVNLTAGAYNVTLYAAGTDTAVFGPTPLSLKNNSNTFIYAVGSLSNSTFTYIVQSIGGGRRGHKG